MIVSRWSVLVLCTLATLVAAEDPKRAVLQRLGGPVASGDTECPLKSTNVHAEISGMLSRVTVAQKFHNPFPETIEAVYIFPLPHGASVDRMTMLIGDRRIKATIKTREEAREVYSAARRTGRTASLLEQERPNIFTQSIANIVPGAEVEIQISYFQMLKYDSGTYELSVPTVVGPRYLPATMNLGDAVRITPPPPQSGTPPGHHLTVQVDIDAGVPLSNITSASHEINVQPTAANRAHVELRNVAEVPNRDFILRYDSAGRAIQTSVLTHRSEKGGFFTLVIQPPARALAADVTPKELIFVLDTSGSMYGFPLEKAIQTMTLALKALKPNDTFNLITFAGNTEILFPIPVPCTPENLEIARLFLASRTGGGGTEMMSAIRAALQPAGETGRVRVVCFMTDGYVGNDFGILAEIRKHPEARIFSFGIGSSVNRFLLDQMAVEGRGEVEYVGLQDDGTAAAQRFEQRVREPLLTGITLDWGNLSITNTDSARIPDLFSAKPVIVTGRYDRPAQGTVHLHGVSGGREVTIPIQVELPAANPANEPLIAFWARQRVAGLMSLDFAGLQARRMNPEIQKEITRLGLEYGLMTQFTSFVAVEETIVSSGGVTRRVDVPVALPQGVSHEGVFGSSAMYMSRFPRSGMGGGTHHLALRPGAVSRVMTSGAPSSRPRPPIAGYLTSQPSEDACSPGSNKLAASLTALVSSSATETVEVQLLLRNASKTTLDALVAAGLEVTQPPDRALQVRGKVLASRLTALTRLPDVRYIVAVRR